KRRRNVEQNKNLLDINIDALYNILKQNQGDVNDSMKSKKKAVVITSDLLALVAEQTKKVIVSSESEGSDDESKKITALLDKAFNQKKLYSKPTNNNFITSSATSSANKKQEYVKKRDMSKVKCYNCKKEGYFAKDCKKAKVKDYEYYKTKMLLAKKDKDEQVLLVKDHTWMESSSDSDQEINANMVFMVQIKKVLSDSEARSSSFDEKIAEIADQEILFDKLSCQLVELDENVRMLINTILEKDLKFFELEECVCNKDLEIEKCLERLDNCENKIHKIEQTNQTKHMIMPSKDKLYNGRKGIDLDTFSSVRRPKVSSVEWKKKGSSNTSKDNLSSDNHSNLNKNVKRYSRKDFMSCNNSYLKDTRSANVCNNAMNASCNARMHAYDDVNDLFVFDDACLRQSHVSKMPFRKNPSSSLNVPSRTKSLKSLPRTVLKWLPKMKLLAKLVDTWIPRIVQICLWIINSGCSKHMTGNHALLTNFVEKFLGTVRFGNNDLAVIACYGDVVIGSMMIKKVCYVEDKASEVIISFLKKTQVNLPLQVQRVRTDNGTEFKNKTLAKFFDEVRISQQFSTARTPQQNGVVERRNQTLVEAARTMLTFANLPLFLWAKAIASACFTQNRLISHKHFDKTPYELINKRKPNIKFFYVFGCRCYLLNDYDDVGKFKAKGDIRVFVRYSKESAAFRVYNKRTRKIHESVNVNFVEISELASKQFSLESGLSNLIETGKSSNLTVSQVLEASKKDLEDLFHNF
nr:retrovirus-related Pol polyprotein from transposon TNT 1-94 [Tanacetum cinerariifolium]